MNTTVSQLKVQSIEAFHRSSEQVQSAEIFGSPCQKAIADLVSRFELAEIMIRLEEEALFRLNRKISCREFYGNSDNLCPWDASGATDQPDERTLW